MAPCVVMVAIRDAPRGAAGMADRVSTQRTRSGVPANAGFRKGKRNVTSQNVSEVTFKLYINYLKLISHQNVFNLSSKWEKVTI